MNNNLSCKKCGIAILAEWRKYTRTPLQFCSKSCAKSRNRSEETKQKISISCKSSEKVLWANRNVPRKRFGKKKKEGYNKTNEDWSLDCICLFCGETIKTKVPKKYHLDCWRKTSGGFRKNSTIKHRCFYKKYQMDSGSEKEFAMKLDELGINWIKNDSVYFTYTDKNNKKRKYYPDFYLTDFDRWVEVKGKFYAEKDENLQLKLQAVSNIEIVFSTEIANWKCSALTN